MKNQVIATVTLAGLILANTLVQAATVQPVNGHAMINKGAGFIKIDKATRLQQGDTVIVAPGGTAKLSYSDGCSIQVKTAAVVTVRAKSPCALKNGQFSEGGMVQTQAAAGAWTTATTSSGGAAGAGAAGAGAAGAAGIGGIGLGAIGLAALGVAAVAGIAAAASGGSGSDNKAVPASP